MPFIVRRIDNKVTATVHLAHVLRGLKCTALLRLMMGCSGVELWGQRARKDAQDPGEVIASGGWGGISAPSDAALNSQH